MNLFNRMSSGLKIASILVVGFSVFLAILFGAPPLLSTHKKNSPSQPAMRQLVPTAANTPIGENITPSQTISLVGGGITFEVPGDLQLNPDSPSTPPFIDVSLYRYLNTQTKQKHPIIANSVDVQVYTGNDSFSNINGFIKQGIHAPAELVDDNSLLSVTNPLFSPENVKSVVMRRIGSNNLLGEHIIELYTNLHFDDGKVRQTNIKIQCGESTYGPALVQRCHDIAQQILTSLKAHEPLQTTVSNVGWTND